MVFVTEKDCLQVFLSVGCVAELVFLLRNQVFLSVGSVAELAFSEICKEEFYFDSSAFEYDDNTVLRNAGNHSPSDTESHPRIPEFWT